jgi:hypothetical protein
MKWGTLTFAVAHVSELRNLPGRRSGAPHAVYLPARLRVASPRFPPAGASPCERRGPAGALVRKAGRGFLGRPDSSAHRRRGTCCNRHLSTEVASCAVVVRGVRWNRRSRARALPECVIYGPECREAARIRRGRLPLGRAVAAQRTSRRRRTVGALPCGSRQPTRTGCSRNPHIRSCAADTTTCGGRASMWRASCDCVFERARDRVYRLGIAPDGLHVVFLTPSRNVGDALARRV